MIAITAKIYTILTLILLCTISLAAAEVLTVDYLNKDAEFEVNGRTHALELIEIDNDGRAQFIVNDDEYKAHPNDDVVVFSDKTGDIVLKVLNTFHSEEGLEDMATFQVFVTGEDGYNQPQEIRVGQALILGTHEVAFLGSRGLAGADAVGKSALLRIDGTEQLVKAGSVLRVNGMEVELIDVYNNAFDANFDNVVVVVREVLQAQQQSLLGQRVILTIGEPVEVDGYDLNLEIASARRENFAVINGVKIFVDSSDKVGPLTVEVIDTQGNARYPPGQKAVVVATRDGLVDPDPLAERITKPKLAVQKARPATVDELRRAPQPQGTNDVAVEVEQAVEQQSGFFARVLAFLFGI